MIRCIVIDDEALVRELLEDNIRQVPFLHFVKACKNPMEAYEVLTGAEIDLIFLDIRMPKLDGLQFLQSLKQPPMVILVTAYQQYALEAFNLHVVDYLLKPFSFERFLTACNKAHELYTLRQKKSTPATPPADFFVNVEYKQVKIVAADIEYVEGLKDYIKIYLSSQSRPVITRMTFKAIEALLPPDKFIRTHKSYLVAADKITAARRDLIWIGEKEIPVSEVYKDNVVRVINRQQP